VGARAGESAVQKLRRWGVRPRKSLGQCFLVERGVTERIAAAVDPAPGEAVIEIGAGSGELTAALAARGAQVWALELDRNLAAHLRVEGNATVLEGDARRARFRDLVPLGPFAVTGNLPYYCTTDLVLHVLDHREGVSRAVFLVQREYADRLCAPPGSKSYGSIGVFVSYFAQVERLFTVPAEAFHPRPEVQSAVVRLTFRADRGLEAAHERALFKVTRRAFEQRRKQLGTALRELVPAGRDELQGAFERAGVDPRRRGETLSLEEFMALAGELKERLS